MTGILVVFALGYQHLFFLEDGIASSSGESVVAPGDAIELTFSLPVRIDTATIELFPEAPVRVTWEELRWLPEFATRASVHPEAVPPPGQTLVLSVEGITSIAGTKLPERLYGFSTGDLPKITRVQCGDGTGTCDTSLLYIQWSKPLDGLLPEYAWSDGRSLVRTQESKTEHLIQTKEVPQEGSENWLLIRLYPRAEGQPTIRREPVWEERIRIP